MKSKGCWIGFGLIVATACMAGEWMDIPLHSTRTGEHGGFEMGKAEVTVAEFVDFLNDSAAIAYPESQQIELRRKGRFAPKPGVARQAVAEVTLAEAQAYTRWKSAKSGRVVRLPTDTEWETAARGGVEGAPFPWGWGGEPSQQARFDADGPSDHAGRFPANGFGLVDMAGNLYEWCTPTAGLPAGQGLACGGSWAERDPALLHVGARQIFEESYRGRDVGIRLVRELDKNK